MSHHEEPKVTEDEEPPTEQDKRKKMVSYKHDQDHCAGVRSVVCPPACLPFIPC